MKTLNPLLRLMQTTAYDIFNIGAFFSFAICSGLMISSLDSGSKGPARGVARIFQRGGGGSHCVKHYPRGVFATEYYSPFS